MASLNISIDELREMSNKFRSLAGKYKSDSIELTNLIQQLSANWMGTEFDQTIHYLNQTAEMNEATVTILTEVASTLSTTAEAYDAAEVQAINDILNSDVLF